MRKPVTPAHRDRATTVMHGLTGVVTAMTVAAVGAASGVAARHTEADKAAQAQAKAKAAAEAAAAQAQAAASAVQYIERPSRTVVTSQVISAAAAPAAGTSTVRTAPKPVTASKPAAASTTVTKVAAPAPGPAAPKPVVPSTGS